MVSFFGNSSEIIVSAVVQINGVCKYSLHWFTEYAGPVPSPSYLSTSTNLNTSPSERPQVPTGNANDGSPGDDFISSGNTRPPTTSTPTSGGGGGGY